jgi:hypothetical protein
VCSQVKADKRLLEKLNAKEVDISLAFDTETGFALAASVACDHLPMKRAFAG